VASTFRLLPLPTGLRPTGVRRLTRVLGLTALVSLALVSSAAPAGAVVTKVGLQNYGVQPEKEAPAAEPSTPLAYEGGPVVHSNAPYAIYWDPKDAYAQWEALTAGFLQGVGGDSGKLTNVYAVATQYRDASGNVAYSSNFRGAFTDADPFPADAENCAGAPPCLSDAQIRAELTKYISANELPGGLNLSTGPTPIYFVFTPPVVTVCLEGSGAGVHCSSPSAEQPLCSYHSFTSVNGTPVLYAVQPWTPITDCQDGTGTLQEPNKSLADVIVNGVADEQIATATDPLLTGWHDAASSGDTNEVPDKCRNEFQATGVAEHLNQAIAGVDYYLNDEFNQAALFDPYPGNPCINEVRVEPQFTAPNPVHSGERVTFNATESYVDLGIAKYHWDFGDGAAAEVNCEGRTPTNGYAPAACNASSGVGNPNSLASVVHQYAFGGTYGVTLTVTDDGGNTEPVTHTITVEGPARPSESATPANPGQATQSSGGSSLSGASPSAHPSPVATQAVVSRSLSTALRSGLVVRYSVNEQVAGRFEVLLASSIASRIGLHGARATGLAKGTPAQTVIAKAILVTTRGGRSTYKIKFSKMTAARLRRLRKVSLMLRLAVHNASSPTVTMVISTVKLSG